MLKKSAIALVRPVRLVCRQRGRRSGVQASGRWHPYAWEQADHRRQVVDDAEWQGAFSQRALQTTSSADQRAPGAVLDDVGRGEPLHRHARPAAPGRAAHPAAPQPGDRHGSGCHFRRLLRDLGLGGRHRPAHRPAALFYAVHRQLRRGALRCDSPTRGGQLAHQQLRHQLGTEEPPDREQRVGDGAGHPASQPGHDQGAVPRRHAFPHADSPATTSVRGSRTPSRAPRPFR
jgi:hypothetical protein